MSVYLLRGIVGSGKRHHVIAHKIDLDGIVCNALFERITPGIEHHDIAYGFEDKALDGIAPGDTVHFCDLGFNNNAPQQRMIETMKALREGGSAIELYDHHDWPASLLTSGLFTLVRHDKSTSSSVIIAKNLLPSDAYAAHIAHLAYCDDFTKPNEEKDALVDVIQSGYDGFTLARHLAHADNLPLVPADAETGLAQFRKDRDDAVALLRASYQQESVAGVPVVTGLARHLLYMKPGWRTMCDDNPDSVIITFYEGEKNVLFEARTPERFARILEAMKGGGRQTGGGFFAKDVVNRERYAELRSDVLTRIKAALE
jgi:hypothetical protein